MIKMMGAARVALAVIAVAGGTAATPANAQFFLRNHEYSGETVRGDEPGISQPLPGATEDEMRAGLVWTMRSALNVAALQCQFEPTLLTVGNYNAILLDHKEELAKSWTTLNKYFLRLNKTPKAGQNALDQFGTRTYSSFATVASQFGFCRTAHSIGRDALFTPRGGLATLAQARMRELRNSLTPYGEQHFPRSVGFDRATMPRMDVVCWDKKARWQEKKCGPQNWPATGASGGTTAVVAAAQ